MTTGQEERFLGIDYGSRRLGVAVSDPTNTIARPVAVVENSPGAPGEIRAYVEEFRITAIVIGLPLTLRGEKGMKAEEVERFTGILRSEMPLLSLIPFDERFSSRQARETLLAMGVKKKGRQEKARIDPMAAALILQAFLDRRKNRP